MEITSKKKTKKVKNPTAPDTEIEVDTDEIDDAGAEETETLEGAAPAAETIEEATIPARPKDEVHFVFTEDIEPPPTIGHYSMGTTFGISKVKKNSKFHIPRHVAEVLVDKKKGAII